MPFTSSFVTSGFLGIRKSDAGLILKESYGFLGKQWHSRFRKTHFTQAAYSLYNYTPRSKAYNRAKLKAVGHTRPLELSGTSKALSETKKVRPTRKGVSVSMPVRVFNFKTEKSKVDKRREFETVADSEVSKLEISTAGDIEKRLSRYRRRKKYL